MYKYMSLHIFDFLNIISLYLTNVRMLHVIFLLFILRYKKNIYFWTVLSYLLLTY